VQLLGLGDERIGLLAQPQRLQIAVVDLVQIRAEDARVAQDLADRPPRAADQLQAADLLRGDRLAQRPMIAGDTAPIASSVSIALTGISPVPTSCWPTADRRRIFARAVTSWRLHPRACATPSRV
jgi:hypothetical protein